MTALQSLTSAQQSLPEGKKLPTLIFLQSKYETVSTKNITAEEYVRTMGLPEDQLELRYVEDMVIEELAKKTKNRTVFISSDLDETNRNKLENNLLRHGFKVTSKLEKGNLVLIYYKDDTKNLFETEIFARRHKDKEVFSLLDTETETEEVEKNGAKSLCIETIMKRVVSDFIFAHPAQIVESPLEVSLREKLLVTFSRRIAMEILRKNPVGTKDVLRLLDFPDYGKSKIYPYTKPSHFNNSHFYGGDRFLPGDGLLGALRIRDLRKSGQLHLKSAEEIASKYFNIQRPTQGQTRIIQAILESGVELGMVLPKGLYKFADEKSRMTYIGVSPRVINTGYQMLHIEEPEE